MSNTARPTDRKISSSASLFKKVLQAFANGDLPYSDVQSHLERLLNTDASPEELREVLNRYESIEPLPAYAHEEILRLLNEAIARAAAPNVDSDPARSQPQDAENAPASISGSLEPIAVAVEARMLPSAVVAAAVAAAARPVTARSTALSA